MHPLARWPVLAAVAFLATAAGCVEAPDPEPEPTPEVESPPQDPAPPEPFHAEGTVWLPPTQGNDRARTELPFQVNATGMTARADVRLGGRYVADLPTSPLADVLVQLVDAHGEVLAETHLAAGERTEDTLEAPDLEAGEHRLVLLSYGGSDGAANGDYVAYALEAAAPG